MPRKPAKLRLSPTRINTYLTCPMKYRYIYFDKIGKFYLKATPGLSFGTSLHNALQNFHAEGAVQTREELQQSVETAWVSAGYSSIEEEQTFKELGMQIIETYHEQAVIRTEQQVFTLFTEKTISVEWDRFILTGRVDRIDQHSDGSLEIIDYKSGRTEVYPEDIQESLAMRIYQLILADLYPGQRVFATIFALRSGESASYEMPEDERSEFKFEIQQIGHEILERDFENVTPFRIPACEYCEFISRCERYWKQNERLDSYSDF